MRQITSDYPSSATSADQLCELIVYACPTGALADQLTHYLERTRREFGPNAAHRYPAHITLTGFFHDFPASVPAYRTWLKTALQRMPRPADVRIKDVMLELNFHGLLIESAWLKQFAASFAAMAHSLTRADTLRLKDWLHLSLAYEFPPEQHEPLKAIAREMIDVRAEVAWELRFYERVGKDQWRCLSAWPLLT